jgi:high frequency lysogenization protein
MSGVFMALHQVRRLGSYGQTDTAQTQPCIRALLADYNGDVAALYGDAYCLQPGLHQLIDHLGNPREAELTRYLVIILALERRLSRHRHQLATIREGLQRAASQAEYFQSPIHRNVISNLGDLYSETLSQLRPRVIVRGERLHLEEPDNAAMIRALLLSAVRGAALWRAVGGRRWRLITGRNRLIETARGLLATT